MESDVLNLNIAWLVHIDDTDLFPLLSPFPFGDKKMLYVLQKRYHAAAAAAAVLRK
jgi:hypothetical protein